MIKINMKLCWLAAFLLVVSFVDLSAQCNPSLSADWSGSGSAYDSSIGVNGVTFDSPSEAGADDTTFSPNGTFNTMNYWSNSAVAGLTSLQYVINWDETPDGMPDIDGFIDFTDPAEDDAVTRTVTMTFNSPIENPVLHIDRLGGNYSAENGVLPHFSNSTMWTLLTPGVTITRLSGNPQFIVSATEFYREPNINLGTWPTIGGEADGTDGMNGTAAGSIQFNGVITTLTFDVTGIGVEGNASDGIEMIFEADLSPIVSFTVDPNPNCDGLDVATTNSSIVNNDLPITYEWTIDGVVVSTDIEPTITFPSSGTFDLTLTVSDGECTSSATESVSVSAAGDPAVTISTETSDCEEPISTTFVANATTGTSISSYSWTVTLPDGSVVDSDQSSVTVESGTGVVSAEVTVVSDLGCDASATATVNAENNSVDVLLSDMIGCAGDVATQEGSIPDGVEITFDPSEGVSIEDGTLSVTVGDADVTYTYTVTSGDCTSDGTFTVTSLLESFDVATDLELCAGVTALLLSDLPDGYSIESTPAGSTTVVDGNVIFNGADSDTEITHNIVSATGCEYSTTTSVTIVEAEEITVDGDLEGCIGSVVTTTAFGAAGSTYAWTAAGNVSIVGATDSASVTASVDGDNGGTLIVSATSPEGCVSSADVTVSALSPADVMISESMDACVGESSSVSAMGPDGSEYAWTAMGGITITSGADSQNVEFTLDSSMGGELFVTVTSPDGCVAMDQITVAPSNTPDVELPDTIFACEGVGVELPNDPNFTYTYTGDCPGTIVDGVYTYPLAATGSGATEPIICTLDVEVSAGDCTEFSEVWSGSGDSFSSQSGGTSVSMSSPDVAGANSTAFTPNGTFGSVNNGYWSESLAGAPSLEMVINWDATPEGNLDNAADDAVTRMVTVTYSSSIANPIIHIDRLGGNRNENDGDFFSNSTIWTLVTPGVTMNRLAGNPQFMVNGNSFYRELDVNLGATVPGGEADGSNGMNGTGAGTIMFAGNVTTLDFMVTGGGVEGFADDGIEFIFSTAGTNCCTQTGTINVQVTPNPVNPANSPISQCEGETVTLNDGALDGYTYSWSATPGYLFTNPTSGTQEVSVTESTTFTVTAAANDGSGCVFTEDIFVEYNSLPVVIDGPTEIELCPGETYEGDLVLDQPSEVWCYYTYTGSGMQETTVFTGSGSTMTGSGAGTFVYPWLFTDTGSGSGVITKEIVSIDGGCSSTYIIPVNMLDSGVYVNADADNPMGVDEIFYCPGDEVTLLASWDMSDVISVEWTGPEGPSTANPWTFVPTMDGTYTVVAQLANGCSATTMVTLTSSAASISLTSSTGDTYCPGEEVTLTADVDPDGAIVTWICDDPAGTTSMDNPLVFTPEGIVTCTATVMNGECEAEASITLTPFDGETIITPSQSTICPGEEVELCIDPVDPDCTYLWSNGETTTCITVSPDVSTEYTVTCTTADGCESTGTATVTVSDAPSVIADASPAEIEVGDSSTLSVTNPDEACTYTWFDQAGNEIGTGTSITVSPEETMTYTVRCTTVDGCTSEDTVTVIVDGPLPCECSDDDIYIPNTFSPNADNTNDVYNLYTDTGETITYEVLIVDRFGECVYRYDGSDFNASWDGTYEGDAVTPDVYGYCVRWTCPCDPSIEYVKTGNITLVK